MSGGEAIFISYRRADTPGYAGRLEDSLTAYFGTGRVFRDVRGIGPGEDFVERIRDGIARADVVIALIGPDWLTASDGHRPRLHEEGDFVAQEIAEALDSDRVLVPVLVEDARMPREEELPERLRALSRKNAVTLTDAGWASDVARLAGVLSLDLSGSVTERRLEWVKRGVLALFGFPLTLGVLLLAWPATLENTHFAVATIFLILGAVTLGATAGWVHPARRRWVWLSVATAVSGGAASVVAYTLFDRSTSAAEALAYTCATLTVSLVLVSLSGFKPNDWMG